MQSIVNHLFQNECEISFTFPLYCFDKIHLFTFKLHRTIEIFNRYQVSAVVCGLFSWYKKDLVSKMHFHVLQFQKL